jgi:hypothetical protein
MLSCLSRAALALALGAVSAMPLARASGSYPPNPPRLGGAALSRIDAVAYNLGKNIFLGRISLSASAPVGADPVANRARLDATQALLPERVRSQIDRPAFAERLRTEQVDALLYYVGIRFRIDIPSAAS